MKIAIAIFAKTIGLSPVKTRLAADIGQDNAEAFYRLSVACVEEVMQNVSKQNPNIHPHWVLAEEAGVSNPQWQNFPAFWTGDGGLGARLANVSRNLLQTHDAVFLVGTDSPQMSPKDFLEALQAFEVNPKLEHVAGPATDGGFWLWGSTKALPNAVWERVSYSVETTLQELIDAVNEHGHQVAKSHSLQDVDLAEDLLSLQKTFEQKERSLLPAQTNLLQWLRENNPIFQG